LSGPEFTESPSNRMCHKHRTSLRNGIGYTFFTFQASLITEIADKNNRQGQ